VVVFGQSWAGNVVGYRSKVPNLGDADIYSFPERLKGLWLPSSDSIFALLVFNCQNSSLHFLQLDVSCHMPVTWRNLES